MVTNQFPWITEPPEPELESVWRARPSSRFLPCCCGATCHNTCMYIYIYRERERDTYVYIYIYVYTHTHTYVYAYHMAMLWPVVWPGWARLRVGWKLAAHVDASAVYRSCLGLVDQECTGKGVGRHGIVLEHRNSLQKEPMPCRPVPWLVQLWVKYPLICFDSVRIVVLHMAPSMLRRLASACAQSRVLIWLVTSFGPYHSVIVCTTRKL